MTKQELDEIRARADAATPGPWEWVGLWTFRKQSRASMLVSGATIVIGPGVHPGDGVFLSSEKTADFITHTREDIPKLLDEVVRLRKMLDGLAIASSGGGSGVEELLDLLDSGWEGEDA